MDVYMNEATEILTQENLVTVTFQLVKKNESVMVGTKEEVGRVDYSGARIIQNSVQSN